MIATKIKLYNNRSQKANYNYASNTTVAAVAAAATEIGISNYMFLYQCIYIYIPLSTTIHEQPSAISFATPVAKIFTTSSAKPSAKRFAKSSRSSSLAHVARSCRSCRSCRHDRHELMRSTSTTDTNSRKPFLYIFCPCWRGAALERLWKARPCLLSHAQRPGTNRHVRHVVSNLCSRYVTTEWSCELVLMRRTAVRNK